LTTRRCVGLSSAEILAQGLVTVAKRILFWTY
jgi:hypothetical protein